MAHVLVTGANGFIARHMVLALRDAGHTIVGLDSCINSKDPQNFFTPLNIPFYQGDISDLTLLEDIFSTHPNLDSIIHFAGLIYVGESIDKPHLYYQANTVASFHFFHYALRRGIKNIVFSSSAGIYGEAQSLPISETHPRNPINPYGRSKLMTEWMLEDMSRLFPEAKITMLRYFNVAGADVQERTGQNSPRAHHLIEVACEAALGLRDGMAIFGTDYDTEDGTCVRDYVHVNDLVDAHLCALRYNQIRNEGGALAMNCGYGHGYSNRQIVETVKEISGVNFPVALGPRREGDPAALVAANDKILTTLDWQPQHADINKIVSTAFSWKKRVSKR